MAMIEAELFWVVMSCGDVGYQRFGGSCSFHLYPEDGGSKDHRRQYTTSQPRRPRIEFTLL